MHSFNQPVSDNFTGPEGPPAVVAYPFGTIHYYLALSGLCRLSYLPDCV